MITDLSQNRLDFFEHDDLTALVCVDVPEVQRLVVEQLGELGYKIHTGLFFEDIVLKLRSHTYDVVIISAHFDGTDVDTNAILSAAIGVPTSQRRRQFLTLIGSSFATGNEMEAFAQSVDLVIGLADVVNFKPLLRRSVNRRAALYAPFNEALKAASR
jgi:CheY-like chemotaxis protein